MSAVRFTRIEMLKFRKTRARKKIDYAGSFPEMKRIKAGAVLNHYRGGDWEGLTTNQTERHFVEARV